MSTKVHFADYRFDPPTHTLCGLKLADVETVPPRSAAHVTCARCRATLTKGAT